MRKHLFLNFTGTRSNNAGADDTKGQLIAGLDWRKTSR